MWWLYVIGVLVISFHLYVLNSTAEDEIDKRSRL
jgi:hypothetical protein